MERAKRRRRLVVSVVLIAVAGAAFALGARLGEPTSPPPQPSVASTLPVPQLVGERLLTGVVGTTVSQRLRAAIAAGRLAGVVLFAENFPSRASGRRLIASLQRIRRPARLRAPLLIMVDQEGGQVKRVDGPPVASAAQMGARGAAFSRQQGAATAIDLRRLGINVDLAPVLDVARPGGVIAATERGFGASAARVAATAVPFARGLQANGVAATAKHFPGLGAAAENTDFAAQRIGLPRRELWTVDEAPYPAFIAAGGKLVMLSTAVYPVLSPAPAAFSRTIASGELRGRLGFRGVSMTDALESAAVRSFGGPASAGLGAVRAGTDLLLFTDLGAAETASRALVAQLRSGRLRRPAFEVSAQRVLDLRAGLSPPLPPGRRVAREDPR